MNSPDNAEWPEVFEDPLIASAAIDRILTEQMYQFSVVKIIGQKEIKIQKRNNTSR